MVLNLAKHTFITPFREYLNLANCNISKFEEQIKSKDSSILNILFPLAKFQAYDILLPLDILIRTSLDKEYLEWWNTIITYIDLNNEIFSLTEKLYQKLIDAKRQTGWIEYSDYEYFACAFSISHIENFVWETCFTYFENIYQKDAMFGLCLFTSGLYSTRIEFNFWKNLDEKILPILEKECLKITASITPNRFETALIQKTVFTFCSELGILYYNIISHMIAPVLSYKKEQLEKLHKKDLIQILTINPTYHGAFYFSETFVFQLELLYQYSEKYQFKSFPCKYLGLCLPVLLQCIGKYEKAAKKALCSIHSLSIQEKANDVLFLALYIAMFTASSELQLRIASVLEETFHGEYQLDSILDLFYDIKNFFKKFANELSMRFHKNKIIDLKENIDFTFYEIYERYIPTILQGKKTGIEPIDDAYWLFIHLFENGKIEWVMEQLLFYICDEKQSYSQKLIYISYFYQLFSALASHLDTEVRICIPDVCHFIDLPESDELKELLDKRELFFIYNPIQIQELEQLNQRLQHAYKNLPSFVSTIRYEKDVISFIKERWIDSQKQVIGSDSKKVLIVNNKTINKK